MKPVTKISRTNCPLATAEINARLDASDRTAIAFRGLFYTRDIDGTIYRIGMCEPYESNETDADFGFEVKTAMKDTRADYGSDPLGNGTFRMVPSGDIVNREERDKRLVRKRDVQNDCLGLSWDQIERSQGG